MLKNPPAEGQNGPGTVVGVNVALSGTLKDQNDIIVYGMVDGEVISEKSVSVGQTAQVKGPVRGVLVTVAGTVRGSIDSSEKLEIMETGKVYGSIVTKDLVVHSGAVVVGKVMMKAVGEEDETAPAEEVAPSEDETKAEEAPSEEKKDETLTPDEE